MYCLGIDLEVDSIDLNGKNGVIFTEDSNITEVGLVVWDTNRNTSTELVSFLVKENRFKKIDQELEELTGIKTEEVLNFGKSPKVIYSIMMNLIKSYNIEAIIAHNGHNFDFPMLEMFFERYGFDSEPYDNLLKIDTLLDIKYPSYIKSKSLIYLAGYYGVVSGNHRAVFDVLAMLNVMTKFDFDSILESAKNPIGIIIAHVSYDKRDLAKNAGFRWNPNKKIWYREEKIRNELEEELEQLEFKCEIKLK